AALLGGLMQALNLVQAAVLAALVALALRALLLLAVDRPRPLVVGFLRGTAFAIFLAAGLLYGWFSAASIVWDGFTVAVAILTAVLVLSGLAVRRAIGLAERRPGAAGPLRPVRL